MLTSVHLCVCLICVPQVRLQLQSCVSRQQEALRCREVWLLGQIELIEQLKTETLQQQLQQLHWVSQRLCFISSLPAQKFLFSKMNVCCLLPDVMFSIIVM